ncbi:hypothetical protein ACNQGO_03325 [Flavobacterium sp. ZT3P35]|uniref:hypothetical protein n=2 Tax=unclassified Flavobacterium TaxID=196869 RepID=UPI003AAE5A0F
MNPKVQNSIFAIIHYFYYLILFIFGFAFFCLLHMIRIKILAYFDFNIFLLYLSAIVFLGIFAGCLNMSIFFHNFIKKRWFQKFEKYRKPTYCELYGEDYPKPLFSDFSLTREEYIELLMCNKNNPKVKAYKNSLKIYHKINNEKWLKSQ